MCQAGCLIGTIGLLMGAIAAICAACGTCQNRPPQSSGTEMTQAVAVDLTAAGNIVAKA